jgi:exodeoxyribonuclease V alpha subunit
VAQESDLIYYKEDTNELAKMSTYNGECLIASFIKEKLYTSKDNEWDIDWNKYAKIDDFQMTKTQSLALKNLCESNISILAGYSGSGKSSSVKGIVSMLEDNNKTYTMLTPTGKSARVLAESTGRKASTIHRRCLQGEISEDCLIVDEFGMVSIELACMIINAIQNEHIKIIFVGDPSQIESINVGTVFDDLIKSNIIPTTMLTEIFRYKSNGSLFVATNIRQGKSFFNDTEMVKHKDNSYIVGSNYKFIDTENIFDNVINEYTKLINKGIKPLNILCLSPMNKGECGTVRINKAIQQEINPPKPNEKIVTRKVDNDEIVFRVKDVVINTKNDYNAVSKEAYEKMKEDNLLTEEDVADTMIMNGQTGTIREILDDGMIIQFDEELIYYSKRKVYNLLLAYSISIHKAQGSTIDYSIEVVSEHHSRMLSRGLLYVGTTRNRISHVDIGNIDAFNNALAIDKNEIRKTWLKDLLLDNPQ